MILCAKDTSNNSSSFFPVIIIRIGNFAIIIATNYDIFLFIHYMINE